MLNSVLRPQLSPGQLLASPPAVWRVAHLSRTRQLSGGSPISPALASGEFERVYPEALAPASAVGASEASPARKGGEIN